MSFAVIPVTTTYPTTGYSTPSRVSFCIQDDGTSGQMYVNGLGVTSASVGQAVDLATTFGAAFRSRLLLRAFGSVPTQQAATDQFNTYLNFSSVFLGSQGPAGSLAIVYLWGVGGGPVNVPYLSIAGANVAGIWRVDLQLRHSIPG